MKTSAGIAVIFALAGCAKAPPHVDSTTITPAPSVASSPIAPPSRALADAALGGGEGAAGKAFGAFCVTNAECAAGVCFHKRIKGADAGHERRDGGDALEHDGYCSMACNDDADCPVPPTKGKCGARGMCKRSE